MCLLCHLSDQLCDTFRFHHLGQFYWCLHAEVLNDLHHFLCELDSDMVVVFVDLVTLWCVEISPVFIGSETSNKSPQHLRCWIAAVRTHYLVLLFFTLAKRSVDHSMPNDNWDRVYSLVFWWGEKTTLHMLPDMERMIIVVLIVTKIVYFPRLCLSYFVFFLAGALHL